MTERDELLKLVKQRRTAVTKKISRIKSTTRAIISGTAYDPRIPTQELNSYSEQALKIHLHELNSFVDRSVQFIGGGQSGRIPLSKHDWKTYEEKQARLAYRSEKLEQEIGDIPLPHRTADEEGRTQTIAERAKMFARQANGNQAWTPFPKYTRDPRSFSSNEKLVAFTNQLSEKDYEEYADKAVASEREHQRKIHKAMGMEEEDELYDNMSDFQFMILWYGTGFAKDKFIIYDIWKLRNEGKGKERYHAGVEESAKNESKRLSQWATSLPETKEEYLEQKRAEAEKKQRGRKRK